MEWLSLRLNRAIKIIWQLLKLSCLFFTEVQKISKFLSSLEMENSLFFGAFFRIYDMQKVA